MAHNIGSEFFYSSNNDVTTLQNVETSTLPIDILKELVREMKLLRAEVSEVKRELHDNKKAMTKLTEEVIAVKLENRQHHSGTSVVHTRQFDNLPFHTKEELQDFDEELKTNDDLLDQFKKMIAKVGGDGATTFLRAAVRRVFSDEVANEFTWRGTIQKPSAEKCFSIYLIKNVAHFKFKCDDKDMNSVLQKHFVHAKERLNAKRKR